MKFLILIIIGLSATVGNCQLTIETYNLTDSLLSRKTTSDTLIWTKFGSSTETFTDDNIILTARNNKGQNLYKSIYTVASSKIKDGKIIYSLSPVNGFSEQIWFWEIDANQVPMVIYRKIDGYTIYYGNIKY